MSLRETLKTEIDTLKAALVSAKAAYEADKAAKLARINDLQAILPVAK